MGQTPANRRFRPLPLVAAIAVALLPGASHAITYTVTSGMDNAGIDPPVGAGSGTLRQAIVDANANCATDPNPVIAFAIGTSPTFIGIGSPATTTNTPLPALQCPGITYSPTIDASTQPGWVANSSTNGFNGTFGISLFGSGLVSAGVCGLSFPQSIVDGGVLTVRGIYFNGFAPVNNSAICGTNMSIFGNHFDQGYEGVKVLASGTASVGNTSASDRNQFTANGAFGVRVTGANTVNVTNNFIGTADGSTASANGIGIFADTTATLQISGNVIAGNSFEGIRLNSQRATIANNKIGVNAVGGSLPNQTGIRTDNSAGTPAVSITNNIIQNNSTFGVHVASGVGVLIFDNSIINNGAANVTLDMYGGPVPNDPGDADTGPNNLQNYPVITSVVPGAGPTTTVNFTFNGTPNVPINFDFYDVPAPGLPGGQTLLAVTSAVTDGAGNSPLTSQTFTGAASFVSMVARNANGDTSEFSPIVAAAAGVPAVSISPPALSFGNVAINTTTPNMTSNLLSTGGSAYQISQLSTGSCYGGPICYGGAEFTCMTDCITFNPYSAGQSCNITANFHPTSLGTQTVNVVVCDNATGSPRTIVVSGTGVPPPTLTVSPSFFDFGNVPVRSQSAPAFFRVQNPANSPVQFTTSTGGPYAVVRSNCQNPIPPNGACDLDVVFAPTAAGVAPGNLVVAPSSGTPAISSLTGNGTIAPVLSLPSNVDILYTLGSPPARQTVTLQNAGLATLTFTSITISGLPFTLVNNCPASLAPGSSCDLVIGFSESNRGTFNGTLTVVSNAPGGSRMITLRGIASPREVPVLEVTPREIGYGQLALGSVTDGEHVKVRNIGGAPAVFDSFVVSPDFVILSRTCNLPLAPLDTCEVLVAMRPLSYGVRFGTLRIRSNAENGPNVVDIFGTSCRGASLVLPRLGLAGGC